MIDNRIDQPETCTVCDEPFTPDEWEGRHSPHDDGCGYETSGLCYCSNEVHVGCCPEPGCNTPRPEDVPAQLRCDRCQGSFTAVEWALHHRDHPEDCYCRNDGEPCDDVVLTVHERCCRECHPCEPELVPAVIDGRQPKAVNDLLLALSGATLDAISTSLSCAEAEALYAFLVTFGHDGAPELMGGHTWNNSACDNRGHAVLRADWGQDD